MAEEKLQQLRRQVRVIAILDACESAGSSPLRSKDLHLIAYFADALAPVWGLRIVDAQLLKRSTGPLSPSLQRDVDLLIGRRVVKATELKHVHDADDGWRIDARYSLQSDHSTAIIEAANRFPQQSEEFAFVREVVFAVSALGLTGMQAASGSDAAYGDPVIGTGSMVDIASQLGRENATASVALRFGKLMGPKLNLAPAEMIHLYVRELYGRLSNAA